MKKNLLALLVAATAFGQAQATGYPAGNVTFNGSLSDTTCLVSINPQGVAVYSDISRPGQNAVVTFPALAPSAFGGINQGPQQIFDLNISNCGASLVGTGMNLMFSGTADVNNPQAFANSTGSATGVAVLLQEAITGTQTFSPNQASTNLPLTIGSTWQGNTINMTATLIQTTNVVPTPGTVTAYATVHMIY